MNQASPTPQRSPAHVADEGLARDQSGIRRAFKLRFKPTRREKCFLMTLAALGVRAAAFWRPIQQRWLTWLVLRAEAPAPSLVDGLIARDRHSGRHLAFFLAPRPKPS